MRQLPHEGLFKNYRICPSCGEKFTPDTATKYRQALAIFIALISLGFTMLLYFGTTQWLVPALISYLILALIIFWGNKKIFLVPYNKNGNV